MIGNDFLICPAEAAINADLATNHVRVNVGVHRIGYSNKLIFGRDIVPNEVLHVQDLTTVLTDEDSFDKSIQPVLIVFICIFR